MNADRPDTDKLQAFLKQLGMNPSILEIHALFTGLNCCCEENQIKNHNWVAMLDLQYDPQNVLDKEAVEALQSYYQWVHEQLINSELNFQLPIDDEDGLMDRLHGLSLWLESFLYAFGLNEKLKLDKFSRELQETLADLVKISRASEYELQLNEEDEQSLFEIQEYVRLAVISLYDEIHNYRISPGMSKAMH